MTKTITIDNGYKFYKAELVDTLTSNLAYASNPTDDYTRLATDDEMFESRTNFDNVNSLKKHAAEQRAKARRAGVRLQECVYSNDRLILGTVSNPDMYPDDEYAPFKLNTDLKSGFPGKVYVAVGAPTYHEF